MDIKKRLSNIFFEHTSVNLDSKQARYWETKFKNSAGSDEDFLKYVFCTPEYREKCLSRFSICFSSLLPEENISKHFESFWQEHKDNEISDRDIIKFITSDDEINFKVLITDVIKDIVSFDLSRSVTPKEIDYIISALRSSDHIHERNMIIDYLNQMPNEMPNEDIIIIPSNKTVVAITANNQNHFDIASGLAYLDYFEDVFNRPMYVQEFKKYIIENDSPADNDWNNILDAHNFSFNKLRRLFQDYTGKSISEYYYVKKYLYAVDDPNFFYSFVEQIINSVEYKSGISKIIVEKYMASYDQQLDDHDVEYIFDIIKSKKLAIVNEEIDRILTDVKQETDNNISHIFKVFQDTLKRSPEISEIDHYTQLYRNMREMNIEDIDTQIEKQLITTLEYHDIIKMYIKDLYTSKNNKDISNSKLFSTLNLVLAKIDSITNANIESIISNLLGDL
jgi:hypothetical protein